MMYAGPLRGRRLKTPKVWHAAFESCGGLGRPSRETLHTLTEDTEGCMPLPACDSSRKPWQRRQVASPRGPHVTIVMARTRAIQILLLYAVGLRPLMACLGHVLFISSDWPEANLKATARSCRPQRANEGVGASTCAAPACGTFSQLRKGQRKVDTGADGATIHDIGTVELWSTSLSDALAGTGTMVRVSSQCLDAASATASRHGHAHALYSDVSHRNQEINARSA